jgi:hypothetical protein
MSGHLPFTSAAHGSALMSGKDFVDLNYLFHRQQVERSRARAARTPEARIAHEELAHRYELQIEQLTGEAFAFTQRD